MSGHDWQEDLDGEVRCANCQAKSWHSDANLPCGSGTRHDNSSYYEYMGENYDRPTKR